MFFTSVFYILAAFLIKQLFHSRWLSAISYLTHARGKTVNCFPHCVKISDDNTGWIQLPLENNFNNFLAVPGKWSRWSPWTDCSRTCGKGGQSRSRICSDKVTGKALKNGWCAGKQKQDKTCADWKCPGAFFN